jgi:hypothetical protein
VNIWEKKAPPGFKTRRDKEGGLCFDKRHYGGFFAIGSTYHGAAV